MSVDYKGDRDEKPGNPLVSIIITVYNVKKYIIQCIKSVTEQTYRSIEIIVVDDGSNDGSETICDQWGFRDKRIKVIHQRNQGVSGARNAGIEKASGKYIYFVDGDDFVEKDLVRTCVSVLEQGRDLVSFGYVRVNEDGEPIGSDKRLFLKEECFELDEAEKKRDFICGIILRGRVRWETWANMYRRDLIEEKGIRFPSRDVYIAEDLFFVICYCSFAEKIEFIPKNIYYYRERPQSITRQRKGNHIHCLSLICVKLITFYHNHEECKLFLADFSIFHFMIMRCAFIENVITREFIADNIMDLSFFDNQMRLIQKKKELLAHIFPKSQVYESLSLAKYYIDGNYMYLRIRNRFISFFSKLIDLGSVDEFYLSRLRKEND